MKDNGNCRLDWSRSTDVAGMSETRTDYETDFMYGNVNDTTMKSFSMPVRSVYTEKCRPVKCSANNDMWHSDYCGSDFYGSQMCLAMKIVIVPGVTRGM